MAGVRHHGQARAGPGGRQVEGGIAGADHVVAPLHDLGRDLRDASHMGQQPAGWQEQIMREVMRLDPREAERAASAALRERLGQVFRLTGADAVAGARAVLAALGETGEDGA